MNSEKDLPIKLGEKCKLVFDLRLPPDQRMIEKYNNKVVVVTKDIGEIFTLRYQVKFQNEEPFSVTKEELFKVNILNE